LTAILAREILLRESRRRLGWGDVCALTAGYAHSEPGASMCLDLQPHRCLEDALKASLLSSEMAGLLASDPSTPVASFRDILPHLAKASREIPLELEELTDLAGFLRASDVLRRFLQKQPEGSIPNLRALAEGLPPVPALGGIISGILNEQGELRADASPELARLKKQCHSLRETIIKKIERTLDSSRYSPHLQDHYYTERNQRYVLPIRVESRSRLAGIVHGMSGSGATLFLEPAELVDSNNRLKVLELDIEREIGRIMRGVSREITRVEDLLRINFHSLTRMDVIQAIARFGLNWDAHYPEWSQSGDMELKNARHPILLAESGKTVVGNTLKTGENILGILISGPNTGGKTVALKMIGLMAVMSAAGFPLTVGPGSRIPFYTGVYADIGDEQDIHRDLSTFSAHVTNIIQIMKVAEPDSLVLLDELMGSTEPREGAALAESILRHCVEKKIRVVITTHYNPLKAMGRVRQDFLNLGCGFDLETMSPTYRLTAGMPEKSSPLEIARRLGMDPIILEGAAGLLEKEHSRLEGLLQELSDIGGKMEKEKGAVQTLHQALEETLEEKKKTLRVIREEQARFNREKRDRLMREVMEVKREIRMAVKAWKTESLRSGSGGIQNKIDALVRSATEVARPTETDPSVKSLKPGDIVEIHGLETRGELLEFPLGRERVRIRKGNFEFSVRTALIHGCEGRPDTGRPEIREPVTFELDQNRLELALEECDLRGLTGEEAANCLAGFLDAAVLSQIPRVKIIHGIGTGTLKRRVMDFLEAFPFPHHSREGSPREGGRGVRVVEFVNF